MNCECQQRLISLNMLKRKCNAVSYIAKPLWQMLHKVNYTTVCSQVDLFFIVRANEEQGEQISAVMED